MTLDLLLSFAVENHLGAIYFWDLLHYMHGVRRTSFHRGTGLSSVPIHKSDDNLALSIEHVLAIQISELLIKCSLE